MRRRWMRPRSSLTGSGYKIDLGPPIFAAFCASWSLAEHERVAFWRGVCQARWSLVSAWRRPYWTSTLRPWRPAPSWRRTATRLP